jgi:hypothetical protein
VHCNQKLVETGFLVFFKLGRMATPTLIFILTDLVFLGSRSVYRRHMMSFNEFGDDPLEGGSFDAFGETQGGSQLNK